MILSVIKTKAIDLTKEFLILLLNIRVCMKIGGHASYDDI